MSVGFLMLDLELVFDLDLMSILEKLSIESLLRSAICDLRFLEIENLRLDSMLSVFNVSSFFNVLFSRDLDGGATRFFPPESERDGEEGDEKVDCLGEVWVNDSIGDGREWPLESES